MKRGIYFHKETLQMVEISYDSFFKAICIVTTTRKKLQIVGYKLDENFKYLGEV